MNTTTRYRQAVRRRVAHMVDPKSRFNLHKQGEPSWDERAHAAAALLADVSGPLEIGDLGCGNQRLRTVLPETLEVPFRYQGYDLHPQSRDVIRLNVQRKLPDRHFDAVFCLGLLEYFPDVESFVRRLRATTDRAVVSYVLSREREQRIARGWRSHLDRSEIEAVFTRSGFQLADQADVLEGRTAIWLWV